MNIFGNEHSVFVTVFWLFFDKFHCVFDHCLKSAQYVGRKLILKRFGVKMVFIVCMIFDSNTFTFVGWQ